MIRRPPRSTRTDTLFPYTTLFRSHLRDVGVGAFHEDRGDIRAPARAGLRAEIKEAVDPGQLLLEHLRDAVLDRFGRCTGVGGADIDLRGLDIGILLERQRKERADAAGHADDRYPPGTDGDRQMVV